MRIVYVIDTSFLMNYPDIVGILGEVVAEPPGAELVIRGDEIDDQRLNELRAMVQSVIINL